MLRSLCLALAALTLMSGCHAKLKKAVPGIEAINVQSLTTGGPEVDLGKVYIDMKFVDDVINTVQDVRGELVADRIAIAVQPQDFQAGLTQGIRDTLGQGPPFGTTEGDKNSPTLQLEVSSYGLTVGAIGQTGAFYMRTKARLYMPDGEKIYRKNLTCDLDLTTEGIENAAEVLELFNNPKKIEEMSDQQLNEVFVDMAWLCGQELVLKLRKHAG